ncbi:MAG: hypothetical protein COA45_10410 [Zetaproteobacteria bacterium]|nr:MAG: hypothetical protein COA45_10410 [Zetaproteobacteria bacterium]
MKHCPVTGVNIIRFWSMSLIGFIFVFGYDFVFHGVLLQEQYQATQHLWRGLDEMQLYFPVAMAAQLALSVTLAYVFTRNFEGSGIGEGVRFGMALGLVLGVASFGIYPYMPIPLSLAVLWFCGTFFEVLGLGVIFSLIYKK